MSCDASLFVAEASRQWHLVGFRDRLEQWIEAERPGEALRLAVTEWIFTRFDDPYRGVSREPDFANLWFGRIPGTSHGGHQAVACSYWVEESTRTLRCDSIATLSQPM